MASITSASTDKRSSSSSSSSRSNDRRLFGLFPYLNDDLKREILSFVADAPMETTHGGAVPINYVKSSLTHQLPHVSRKFRDLSQADSYWKDAVLRQTKKEPILWETALREIISQNTVVVENASNSNVEAITSSSHDQEPRDALALIQRALEAHHHQQQQEPQESSMCYLNMNTTTNCEHHHSSSSPTTRNTYKSLYRHVVSNHLRFKGPVFFMPGNVQLGEPYALHFFEPRYRFLIAEVMRDFPDEAKQGGHIGTDSRNKVPIFLHANRGPLAATTPAVVVQVLRCEIHDNNNNGHADVVLLPLHHVWLEKVWVSGPQAPGNLYYAQALRMPQQVTHSMNQLARQEILANVMDQIATTLSSDSISQEDRDEDDDDAMDSSDNSSSDDDDDSLDDDDQSDFSDSDVDDDDIEVDIENAQGP